MAKNNIIRNLIASVLWLSAILWMFFIFSMSAQTSVESGETSGNFVDKVADIIIPGYDAKPEAEKEAVRNKLSFPIRKLAHFTEFAVLGALLTAAVTFTGKKVILTVPRAAISLAVGWLYAFSDEFHQFFVPGRAPALKDVLIDGAGVTCGTIFVFIIVCIVKRTVEKKKSKND